MQIKATKEIRHVAGQIYLGLTWRNIIFGISGIATAALVGFTLHKHGVSDKLTGLACAAVATPFALLAFVKWHGMHMEQIIQSIYRSRQILSEPLYFRPENENKKTITEYLKLTSKKKGRNKNAEQ